MINTANYIARKYGVRSAMPTFVAKKLCSELIVLDPHFKKYEEKSKIMKGLFSIIIIIYIS